MARINGVHNAGSTGMSGLDIDWSLGENFYKEVSSNSTITFSNIQDGKVVLLVIRNTSNSNITLTLPSGIYKDAYLDLTVPSLKENVYTFIRTNGKTYVSYVVGLTNL